MADKWTIDGVEMTSKVPTEPGWYPTVYRDGSWLPRHLCDAGFWDVEPTSGRQYGPRLPDPVKVPPKLTCWCGNSVGDCWSMVGADIQVKCIACGISGPLKCTKDRARAAWLEMRGEQD